MPKINDVPSPSAPTSGSRAVLLFAACCISALLYLFFCFIVYRNARQLEVVQAEPVGMEQARKAEQYASLHNGTYFRSLADKLVYFPHEPQTILSLYDRSLRKAPANYETFFSDAYYIAATNCCREKVLYLLQETVRRCPTNPKMYRIAATYFLTLQDREKALPFLKHAIELEPASAQELYRLLQQNQAGIDTFLAVTPDRPEALVQLGTYLQRLGDSGHLQFLSTIQKLSSMKLTPSLRLRTAELALQAGLPEIARQQADAASQDPDTRPEAFKLIAVLLWKEGKKDESNKFANQVERLYREQGSVDRAADYSLQIASMMMNQDDRNNAKERLLKILNDYPRYAPAYFQMAQFSHSESQDLELFYLQKASDLAPDNTEYRRYYAQRLLETGHPQDAEAIYTDLLTLRGSEREAYQGWARAKQAEGKTGEAISILQQGMARGIQSPEIQLQIGQLYSSIGEYQKAADSFIEFAKSAPDRPDGWILAGDAYMNLGRYAEARDQYRKALEIDPQNQNATKALSNLQLLGYS